MSKSEEMKRRWQDPAWRAKMIAANTGRTKSPEDRAAIAAMRSAWWKAADRTETKAKIGANSAKVWADHYGSEHPAWKGGRYKVDRDGYIYVRIHGHPNARKDGYVLEHRAIMAEAIGRPLAADEDVNHINGTKDDNRLENLTLVRHHAHYNPMTCPNCGFEWRTR